MHGHIVYMHILSNILLELQEKIMNDTSGIDTINTMNQMAQIMDAVSPIFDQLKTGIGNHDVPEGGIFDSFVRGYIFGYVNNLIAFKGGGSIDKNPNAAMEIFNVMFGTPYTGGNEGAEFFKECLADRNAPESSHDNHDFTEGFISGKGDYSIIVDGQPIKKLSMYLNDIFA